MTATHNTEESKPDSAETETTVNTGKKQISTTRKASAKPRDWQPLGLIRDQFDVDLANDRRLGY